MGEDAGQAVVFFQQFDEGGFIDAAQADDVIDGVAFEGEKIGNQGRAQVFAEAQFDVGSGENLLPGQFLAAGFGADLHVVVAEQLGHVLVVGDDEDAVAGGPGPGGERTDDIVGLDAGPFHQGEAEGAEQVFGGLQLFLQGRGHGVALGLVVRVELVAEGGGARVEDHGQGRRLVLLLEKFHIAGQAENCPAGAVLIIV